MYKLILVLLLIVSYINPVTEVTDFESDSKLIGDWKGLVFNVYTFQHYKIYGTYVASNGVITFRVDDPLLWNGDTLYTYKATYVISQNRMRITWHQSGKTIEYIRRIIRELEPHVQK